MQSISIHLGRPIEAAKFIVAEAYRLWLEYDERTDDISIIIIYFSEMNEAPRPSIVASMLDVMSGKDPSPRCMYIYIDVYMYITLHLYYY